MQSCIYEGFVTHCRYLPIVHRFRYGIYMLYLDLRELPEIVGPGRLISAQRFALASFLAQDHLTGAIDLAGEVRRIIAERTGESASGPIRMLTHLRYFGYYFSPLNLFYVSDAEDRGIEYVLAEVNNTPWKERHIYVLWRGNQCRADRLRFEHPKQFHVSPFMDMDQDYRWRLNAPGQRVSVTIENRKLGRKIFSAGLFLRRRDLTRKGLAAMSIRYPWMTARIIAAIHYQALVLWLKKCPTYTHPEKLASSKVQLARSRRQ